MGGEGGGGGRRKKTENKHRHCGAEGMDGRRHINYTEQDGGGLGEEEQGPYRYRHHKGSRSG